MIAINATLAGLESAEDYDAVIVCTDDENTKDLLKNVSKLADVLEKQNRAAVLAIDLSELEYKDFAELLRFAYTLNELLASKKSILALAVPMSVLFFKAVIMYAKLPDSLFGVLEVRGLMELEEEQKEQAADRNTGKMRDEMVNTKRKKGIKEGEDEHEVSKV